MMAGSGHSILPGEREGDHPRARPWRMADLGPDHTDSQDNKLVG